MEATGRQLTLAVDDPHRELEGEPEPISGAITISGRLAIRQDLYRREELRVLVTDADGAIVATGLAAVAGVRFELHDEKNGLKWTERVHRLRLT